MKPDIEAEIARHILRHWQEAVPDDRMAHLVKDASRAFLRALQVRLAQHGVQLGHWVFLRILWQRDGLTKRELSAEAGVMEPTTFVALRATQALGYVVLEQAQHNRKNVCVRLTPQARRLEQVLVPLAREVNRIAMAKLDEAAIEGHPALSAHDDRQPVARRRARLNRGGVLRRRLKSSDTPGAGRCLRWLTNLPEDTA